jgi:hypothetical protein
LVHKRKPVLQLGSLRRLIRGFAYLVVKAIPDIEKNFGNAHSTNEAQAIVGLRDTFTFLLTLHAILRGESVYKAEALQHINYIQGQQNEALSYCFCLIPSYYSSIFI